MEFTGKLNLKCRDEEQEFVIFRSKSTKFCNDYSWVTQHLTED